MKRRTRVIRHAAGQDDRLQPNFNTRLRRVRNPWAQRQVSANFHELFTRHYAGFREDLLGFEQLGVAVVAIDMRRDRLAGVACAAAMVGEPRHLVIGRHSSADLMLDGDGSVSLRHAMMVVEPIRDFARDGRGVRFRVMDLRSMQGLGTEDDKTLGGVRSDGPAFFTMGDYAIYFLITGDPSDWPVSSHQAWSFLPERVYLDELEHVPQGSGQHRLVDARPIPMKGSITFVQRLRAPIRPRPPSSRPKMQPVHRPRDVAAVLQLVGGDRNSQIDLSTADLAAGVLLGRAERCDGYQALDHPWLSRVHLLIARIGDGVYAFDAGSTNGSFAGAGELADEFRWLALESRAVIQLGTVAELRWYRSPHPRGRRGSTEASP